MQHRKNPVFSFFPPFPPFPRRRLPLPFLPPDGETSMLPPLPLPPSLLTIQEKGCSAIRWNPLLFSSNSADSQNPPSSPFTFPPILSLPLLSPLYVVRVILLGSLNTYFTPSSPFGLNPWQKESRRLPPPPPLAPGRTKTVACFLSPPSSFPHPTDKESRPPPPLPTPS